MTEIDWERAQARGAKAAADMLDLVDDGQVQEGLKEAAVAAMALAMLLREKGADEVTAFNALSNLAFAAVRQEYAG